MYPVTKSQENCTKSIRFNIRARSTGLPVDLTGYKVRYDLRRGAPDEPGEIVLPIRSYGDGAILTVNGPAGEISGKIPPATMARSLIPAGDYCAQLILISPEDDVVARGWVVWIQEVSSEGRV